MIRMATDKSHVIGQGTYGCAVRPKARCKKSMTQNTRKVGKLVSLRDADIELRVGALVKGIPDWEKYYIVQEKDDCDAENMQHIRREYHDECKIFQKNKTGNIIQIVSTYGGKTLISSHPMSGFNYLESFRHILEGVDRLQDQGICHHDLKDNNITVDENGTLRIIDFGAAFMGDNVKVDGIKHKGIMSHKLFYFYPEYNTFSPEYTIMCGLKKVLDKSDNFDLSLLDIYNETLDKKPIFGLMATFLNINRATCKKSLIEFWNYTFNLWKHKDSVNENKWDEFVRTYWRTWDTWAVGVIYLKLLKNLLLNPNFIDGVWKKHATTIKKVFHGLLEVDPRKRLSAKDAKRMLTF